MQSKLRTGRARSQRYLPERERRNIILYQSQSKRKLNNMITTLYLFDMNKHILHITYPFLDIVQVTLIFTHVNPVLQN